MKALVYFKTPCIGTNCNLWRCLRFKYILNSILVIFLYKVMGLSELEIGFVVGSAAVGF